MPSQLAPKRGPNRYSALIEKIFFDHYVSGDQKVLFHGRELKAAADKLGITLPANPPDVIYSVRHRSSLPQRIISTQPNGKEWIIEGVGCSQYAFKLATVSRIAPNPNLVTIKMPDATPEIISAYSLTDEQALLAKVRYNRIIDIFLGIATYSLQSHLRTTVKGIGQIEIDEIYVGVDRAGRQFIVPVQAKGGSDKLGPVQTKQDIAYCAEKFPQLVCRAISIQFMESDVIAVLELTLENEMVKLVSEEHYLLVAADQISPNDLVTYRQRRV